MEYTWYQYKIYPLIHAPYIPLWHFDIYMTAICPHKFYSQLCYSTPMFWITAIFVKYCSAIVNWLLHYGNQSRGYLMGGGGEDHYDHPLCPGWQPGPPSQTPGGLGQRYWSVSEVTWPPKSGVSEMGFLGPSSVMIKYESTYILQAAHC